MFTIAFWLDKEVFRRVTFCVDRMSDGMLRGNGRGAVWICEGLHWDMSEPVVLLVEPTGRGQHHRHTYDRQHLKTLHLEPLVDNQFDIFVQWLNPGHSDTGESYDRLGLLPWLIGHEASISMRDGKELPKNRTEELRQFIYGWAKARSLTFQCP